jgi:hypothetical protein
MLGMAGSASRFLTACLIFTCEQSDPGVGLFVFMTITAINPVDYVGMVLTCICCAILWLYMNAVLAQCGEKSLLMVLPGDYDAAGMNAQGKRAARLAG